MSNQPPWSPTNPWQPSTDEDWSMAKQRAMCWVLQTGPYRGAILSSYPWWDHPANTMTPTLRDIEEHKATLVNEEMTQVRQKRKSKQTRRKES